MNTQEAKELLSGDHAGASWYRIGDAAIRLLLDVHSMLVQLCVVMSRRINLPEGETRDLP